MVEGATIQGDSFSAGGAEAMHSMEDSALAVGNVFFQEGGQAGLNCLSHPMPGEVGSLVPSQKSPCFFPFRAKKMIRLNQWGSGSRIWGEEFSRVS